jgi:superfamily II DNA/RNA helicase
LPLKEVFDALGFSGEDYEGQNKTSNLWLGLEQIIGDWDLKTPDSKFEVLAQALQNRFYNEPGVKIIVFSFFKKTLSYLRRRLVAQGFNPLLIHGDVPIEDRQQIIDTFREDHERQILLSSEVGSEGVDLQFCRIIVNYDLPWNPMKVEQRIGRIDRLGQKADKITILNLSVADTIEEKILERLYNRIGIFQRSLGDLEQILGDVTEKLHTELLSHRLTRQQEDERIEDTQRAVETKLQLEGELVEQSAVFLGVSEYILQQIGQARDQGR